MLDLWKLFSRTARPRKKPVELDSSYHPSEGPGEGLEVEYQALISTQFRRWGISPASVTIEAKKLGRGPEGYDIFVGMVRLASWHRVSALRVLIGLPLLEAKLRKSVQASWLADYSHFGGLWLHASEGVGHGEARGELRALLMQVAPPSSAPGTEASQDHASEDAMSIPATEPPANAPVPRSSLSADAESIAS